MRKAVLLMLLVVFSTGSLFAQAGSESNASGRVVEILNADSARTSRVDGKPADMLSGNVALRQGETLLSADRAVRFKTEDRIIFEGSVLIIDEGDSLAADRVVYESDVKTGVGTGNVRWSDGEVAITASLARYFVEDKVAEFEEDVVMQDSATTILSRYGAYDVEGRVASFRDDIYLEQRRLALTAEAMTHERESGLTTALGRVWIYRMPGPDSDDASARVILVADTASSERDSGMNRLAGNTGLVRIETGKDQRDTLIVRSSSVVVEFADSTETFDAHENVRFWRGGLAGMSDSLSYSSVSDTAARVTNIRMLGDPFVWSDDAQVSGDTVDVLAEGGRLRELHALGNAYVGLRDSTHDYIQQLKGRRLEALFEADSLRRVIVRPNAEAIYFAPDSTSDDKLSALRFTAMQIVLRFSNGSIDRIMASEDVEGDLNEVEADGALPMLQGFRWRAPERPKREEVLDQNVQGALERFESF